MQSYQLESKRGKSILFDLNLTQQTNAPLVIFCHGFKGFKDWGAFNYISQQFVSKGLNFLKFNFSHNGTTLTHPTDFVDLESFGKNNFSIELEDLESIIDWVKQHLKAKVNLHQLYLMGHSRGGGISILMASKNPFIKKLVSWASVSNFEKRLINNKLSIWKKRGVAFVFNSRTNQQMPLYYQFYEDFIKNKETLSIPNASKKLLIPTLIIHGLEDSTVDFSEAKELKSWIKKSEMIEIKNADHVFNAKHPFSDLSVPKELKTAIDESISFFKR